MNIIEKNNLVPVLLAEDSESVLSYLTEVLTNQGYKVYPCKNGTEAWEVYQKHQYFPIILLDWEMPGITGPELSKLIKENPKSVYSYIILLTARDSEDEKIQGLSFGADDYLTKPFSTRELLARLKAGLRISDYEKELVCKEAEVRLNCYKMLTDLAETRDLETGEHITRIATLSARIAKEIGCEEEFCNDLALFAPMHDIGKVGIPDGILHLPRKLNTQEFEIMKTHTTLGWQILRDKSTLEMAAEIAYSHHEKWDGTGYPLGLSGEDIPLSGRIVSIIDVYDALRSVRPYKPAYKHEESARWIIQAGGKSFDPKIAAAFEKIQDELDEMFNSMYDSSEENLLL